MTFKAAKGAFLITEPCVAAQVLEALEASPQDGLRAPPCLSTSLVWRAGSAVSPCKLGSRCLPRWHQPAGSPLGEGQAARGRDRGGFAARRLDQPGGGSFASSFRQTHLPLRWQEAGQQRGPSAPQTGLCPWESHCSVGDALTSVWGSGSRLGGSPPPPALRGAAGQRSLSFSTCEGQLGGAVGFYLTWVGRAVLEPQDRAVTWGRPPGPTGKGHMCEVDRPNPHMSRLPVLPTPP